VVRGDFLALPSAHSIFALALTTVNITRGVLARNVLTSTKIAVTVLAPKKIVRRETKESLQAGCAPSCIRISTHSGFTGTLSVKLVTDSKPSNCSVSEAVAAFATLGQMAGEVPIEGFARVANPSGHLLLAVAQLSFWDTFTSTKVPKVVAHARRVAVTQLTQWVVVCIRCALFTFLSLITGFARAHPALTA
jgi:hypothetical protein